MEDGREYTFFQFADIGSKRGTWIESMGAVYIQPAPKGSIAKVVMESVSNDERIMYSWNKHTTAGKDTIITTYPIDMEDWDDADGAPCVQLQATIYIPQDTVVDKFVVSTTTANIVVRNGVSLRARKLVNLGGGQCSLHTPTLSGYEGGVEPYKLQTPELKVEQITGNVTGWFPLYDETEIGVGQGAIDVQIQPKPARDNSASAAQLIVGCGIGTLNVTQFWGNDTQLDAAGSAWTRVLPVREYNADITTLKGPVHADILISNTAKITAKGDVDFTFHPLFLANRPHAKLEFSTTVSYGATNGRVREPIWASSSSSTFKVPPPQSAELRQTPNKQRDYTIVSRHASFPGDCEFSYPESWSGSIDYHSVGSGIFNIGGEGEVEIIRSGTVGGLVYMEAVKGKGSSDMRFDLAKGNVDLLFDDESNLRHR